jgi:hypothetical protein
VIVVNGRRASIVAALHLTKFLFFLHGCVRGLGPAGPQKLGTIRTSLSAGLRKKLSLKQLPRRAENSKQMWLLLKKTRDGRFLHLPRGSADPPIRRSADHRPSRARKCREDDQGDPQDRPGQKAKN